MSKLIEITVGTARKPLSITPAEARRHRVGVGETVSLDVARQIAKERLISSETAATSVLSRPQKGPSSHPNKRPARHWTHFE